MAAPTRRVVRLIVAVIAYCAASARVAAGQQAGATARAAARTISRTQPPAARWMRPWAEVLCMADRRQVDTIVVRTALAPDAPIALVTVTLHALGQIRDPESERLLVEALGDGSSTRAAAAAFGLGTLGRFGLQDITWAVLERVALSPHAAAAAAVRALLPQANRAARVVRALMADSLAPREARAAAMVVAGQLREIIIPPPELVLHRDTVLSRAATYGIARVRRAAGARTLLARATQTSPPSVLALVARGLARSATGDSLADTAVATLRRLVVHADAQVRTEAVLALTSHGARAAASLRAALADRHPLVRQVAAAGVVASAQGDTAAVRLAWEADTALHVREAVLQSMAGWTTDAVPVGARAWAEASDWRRRALFAQLVLPIRTRYVGGDASSFDALLGDAEARVRRAALEGMMAAGAPPFMPRLAPERLRRATDDPSPLVRAAAWGILARSSPDTADVPRALAAWAVAVKDTVDEDARTGIARFLGAAYARATTSAPGETTPRRDWRDEWSGAIAALPAPADPAEATRLLPMFGRVRPTWAMPGATGAALKRPIAWYDSLVRHLVWPSLAGRRATARLETNRGAILVTLDGATAPLTVENLTRLARARYFDGIIFHRVVPAFVAQGGDPTGTGSGGPGYAIRDELSPVPYQRGELGMALSGPDTGGSQWFLTLTWQPHLTGGYTIFGRVASGWGTLDAIRQYDHLVRLRVVP